MIAGRTTGGEMDEVYLKRQLALNRDRVAGLARGISEDQARWKPNEESWSTLEVICHLADEEEFDFPYRLQIILEKTEKDWPEIDPVGWFTEHNYHEADLFETLNRFVGLRNEALAWLDSVDNPDWETSYQASFGEISAGDMFAAWVAHDLLHMRQLIELQRFYLEDKAKPYRLDYGGEW